MWQGIAFHIIRTNTQIMHVYLYATWAIFHKPLYVASSKLLIQGGSV